MQELITGFASHLLLVIITILILVAMLIINFFIKGKDQPMTEALLNKEHGDLNSPVNDKRKVATKTSLFPKLIFSSLLFTVIMAIGSLNYIKNMDIYYVVLKKDLTKMQALDFKNKFNQSKNFNKLNLWSRVIPIGNNNYEVILFNGYVSPKKATEDLKKVESATSEFKPYRVGPQKTPSFSRKIKYLQINLFNQYLRF
jgi:hypothetical protein